jgi:adenylyl cyclase-associated protein
VRELAQSINVDKCDGVQIILNRASLNAEILSAKCSELNIVVPGENEGDEFTEHAIPEQFTSKWDEKKKQWVTVSMAHSG